MASDPTLCTSCAGFFILSHLKIEGLNVLHYMDSSILSKGRNIFLMQKSNCLKMMERAGILLLLCIPLLLVSCLSWIMEKPTFTLQEITLSPRSLTEMSLLLVIEVDNPNHFDFTLKSLEYNVYLTDENIGKGCLEKEYLISSSSKTRIQVPIDIKFKNLGGSLKAVLMSHNLPYRIEGNARIKMVFENVHFPFSNEGRINLNGFPP